MSFVNGFLALCSATSVGAAVEIVASGYARQPIAFGNPVNGVSASSVGFDFGPVGVPSSAGRAVFDTPTAGTGNLLFVMPHANARLPAGGSIDRGPAGYMTLVIAAMAGYPNGEAFNGTFTAGTRLGLCYDLDDVIGLVSTVPNAAPGVTVFPTAGRQFLRVAASPLSAGVALTVRHGQLQAAGSSHSGHHFDRDG